MKKSKNVPYMFFRVFMICLSGIFLLWFMLPIFRYGILNAFNGMGIIACTYVLLFYCAREKFRKWRKKFYKNNFSKFLWRFTRFCIYAFGIYGFIISIIMAVFANIPPAENSTEIMLGAQVKGTNPTLTLYDRITAGEKYLKENSKSVCVATGGLGDTATITEAQCMYNVLTLKGIDGNRIYLENNAKNTKENIQFSYEIIKQEGINENIAIVSDGFHQARARLIARKLGIKSEIGAVSAKTNWIYLPIFWVREWFGLPYDLLLR